MRGVHLMLSGPVYVLPILILRLKRVIEGFSERPLHVTNAVASLSVVLRRGPYDCLLRMGSSELRVRRTSDSG